MVKRRRTFELLIWLGIIWGLSSPAPAQAQQFQQPGPFFYKNITTDTTTVLKAGPGMLHCVTINNPTATEVITIYDNTSATGTKIGTIDVPASPQISTLCYDVQFGTGLTITTATALSDLTVSFR